MTDQSTQQRIEELLSPYDKIIIAAADLEPGMAVVDLGCGTGSTAALAATQIGPAGRLLAVDNDPGAVRRAEERLASLSDVATTRVVDLNTAVPNGPWDRVLSRFVLMLIRDPAHLLGRVRTQTAENGRAAFMVWGPPEDNPWHVVPANILAPNAPAGHVNRPFRLGRPDQLHDIAKKSGYRSIQVAVHAQILRVADSADAAVSLAMADMRANPEPQLAAQLRSAIGDYVVIDGGVEMPASALLLTVSD